ncbi:hypothetical protein [Nocardia yamanashiensis]|nr:hypothetical protein [Nocardia yamanashiensis]
MDLGSSGFNALLSAIAHLIGSGSGISVTQPTPTPTPTPTV